MRKRLFVAVPLCMAFLLAGCALVTNAQTPALVEKVLVDPSVGSGVNAASATTLVESLLPELVARRGTILFYRLDEVEGAVLAGRFVVGMPLRDSKSAIAAFERDRTAEGRRTFLLLRDSLFASTPRSSPLALALTVLSSNPPRHAEVRYYLASDAREWTPAGDHAPAIDTECHPPTVERWLSALHDTGRLMAGSLRGSTVYFVGVRPSMVVPGDRCPASLTLMNQTRALWEAAISAAGGKVVFASDHDELPNSAVLFFFGSSLLWWRKQRVKMRAKLDLKRMRYAAKAIIVELIGPKPWLDESDPEHETAQRRLTELRPLIATLKARLRTEKENLANHVKSLYLMIGVWVAAVTESVAWTIIMRDAGVSTPERYLMGVMLGFFFIILIMLATKYAEKTGNRKWLITCIVVISIIALSATYVRVNNALTTGASVSEELALGVLLLCAALGPAVAVEYLLRPLRAMLPFVRLCKELKKQLREAERELKEVSRRLTCEARLRRAWEWEYATLLATYDGINPPPEQESVIALNTGILLSPASGPVNGIPLHGGTAWTDSGSSSTQRPS